MRGKTRQTVQELVIGFALGAGLMGSFLWIGLGMHFPERPEVVEAAATAEAAEREVFPDLMHLDRTEIRDLIARAGAEDERLSGGSTGGNGEVSGGDGGVRGGPDAGARGNGAEPPADNAPGGESAAYSQSDLDLLAALVWAEAGDQPFDGMRVVADCVCNRASDRHPEWPSTIAAVIYQPGQFSVVANGRLDQGFYNATPECYEAARLALSGDHYDTNVIYFSMYYCANGVFAYQIGDHYIGY